MTPEVNVPAVTIVTVATMLEAMPFGTVMRTGCDLSVTVWANDEVIAMDKEMRAKSQTHLRDDCKTPMGPVWVT